MYAPLLILHSWLRWVVLLTALLAIARAVRGRSAGTWGPADDAAGKWFVISLDVQVLIGLILYLFLSPYTMAVWGNMGEAMGDSFLRFMAVEHLFGMVAGTALAHVGRARARKGADPRRRHTQALIFFTIALVVILASVPWPWMPVSRPLFRTF